MATLGDRMVARLPYALLAITFGWVTVHAWGPLKDPDSWWHLRLGEDFLHQGSLNAPDHWSSFATASWTPTEPVPEIVVALVRRGFGLPGVVWVYVVTVVLVVAAAYLICRLHASPLPAVVATVLFVAAGQGSFTARPQLLSYLFMLVLIEAWTQSESHLRAHWWLVPMCWGWSLCHGFWFIGVAYGFLCVGAVAFGRRADRRQLLSLAAVALLSLLTVLLNPVGVGVVTAPFEVSQFTQYVTEWARPSITSGPPLVASAMALAVVGAWLIRPDGFTWFRGLLVVSALFWDWYAIRTIVVGALVVTPLLATALQALIPAPSARIDSTSATRERMGLLAGVVALVGVAAMVVPHTAARPGDVPVGLDAQLDRLPAGTPVFNAYPLGGWIAWRHPDLNQYIDGLITPYTAQHASDYHRTQVLDPGWYAVVRASGAPVALLESDSSLAAALQRHGWTSSGTEKGYVLLHRPEAAAANP